MSQQDDEWGPWIEHDGAEPEIRGSGRIEVRWFVGVVQNTTTDCLTFHSPHWYWRRRPHKKGWFGKTRFVPICDQPEYSPIMAYRVHKPRALRDLIRLAEQPRVGIPEDA